MEKNNQSNGMDNREHTEIIFIDDLDTDPKLT